MAIRLPIVHRDLTPDNLVVRNDGALVLIDFGAANQFVGSATGTVVGKQACIAPEQLRGKTVPESDLYSLGRNNLLPFDRSRSDATFYQSSKNFEA